MDMQMSPRWVSLFFLVIADVAGFCLFFFFFCTFEVCIDPFGSRVDLSSGRGDPDVICPEICLSLPPVHQLLDCKQLTRTFKKINELIYLAALGLRCDMQDLVP